MKLSFKNMFVFLLMFTLMLAQVTPASAAFSINETFSGTTAPGWTLLGTAVLTENTVDAGGAADGWLRLTDAVDNQAGSAIYNTAFSSFDGVQVDFNYANYGGNGADGFTFYLIDGSTTSPTVGGAGPGLGYGTWTSFTPPQPGVTNGYVGIGFDEWGNFSYSDAGTCNHMACETESLGDRQNITVRGSGSLYTGFDLLSNHSVKPARTIDGVSRPGRHVRITILDNAITVQVDYGAGLVTEINSQSLLVAGQATMPNTFKMGFSASTGGSNNIHEIGGLTVNGIKISSSTALGSSLNPSTSGNSVTFTATVTGSGATPTGNVTFYDGAAVLNTVALDGSGIATYTTSALTVATHTITARYVGNSTYGISEGNVSQVVNPLTYTVTYDANGATGGTVPGDQTKTHDVDLTLATNSGSLVKTGYTFSGWNTQANGLGTNYAEGGTYAANAAVTLYAKWTLNTYTVTYDANGATGGTVPGDQTKTHDVDLTLATNSGSLVKTGYTFSGWNTLANGAGTNYAAGGTYAANAAVTLYAKWTPVAVNHTVTFKPNGGSGSMSPQTASSSAALTLNAFTRTGYTFAGWNTTANGGGTAYANGATYNFAANLTLYAQWTPKPSTNLLRRPDFSGSYVFPYTWKVLGAQPPYASLLDCDIFRTQPCSVRLTGGKRVNIVILQMVKLAGKASDAFSFGISNRASGVPATGGSFQVEVLFYDSWNTIVGTSVLEPAAGSHDWKVYRGTATAPGDYTHIVFRFIYQKPSGTAWFDNAFLRKLP